jgi:hypothetical protein
MGVAELVDSEHPSDETSSYRWEGPAQADDDSFALSDRDAEGASAERLAVARFRQTQVAMARAVLLDFRAGEPD